MNDTAVTFGSVDASKTAALFFDHVVDLWIGPEVAPKELWPDSLRAIPQAASEISIISHTLAVSGMRDTVENTFKEAEASDDRYKSILLPKKDGSTNRKLVQNYLSNEGGVDVFENFLVGHRVFDPAVVVSTESPLEAGNEADVADRAENVRLG